MSVDRLKPHTGLGPVSPAEAASRGRPPKMRLLLLSSLHLHEVAVWGGPMWRIVFSLLIYIYVVLCLANYGASEAVYPCIVVEKIHEYFRPKNAPISLVNKSVVV